MAAPHRKRCKRYDLPGDAHALTFSCYQRMPLLSRDRSCRWMLDALDHGRQQGMYDLWAYVIMPEHVHLVIWPHDVGISAILKSLKQSVSKKALLWLAEHDTKFLDRLRHTAPNGRVTHRFWQRGGGYDRNLQTVSDVHEKVAYVHNNPVRRGLVELASQWHWSSCIAWETGQDDPIAIDRATLPRDFASVP